MHASDRYFAEMRTLTRESFRARQAHSLASLGFGAAGVAFSHWYVGTQRSDPGLLAEARRWLEIAESFASPPPPSRRSRQSARAFPFSSLVYGPLGLAFVKLLVACSAGDSSRERQIEAFTQAVRSCSRGAPSELVQGIAGHLFATAFVYRRWPDRRLGELGDRLARRLMVGLEGGSSGPMPVRSPADLTLAHGLLGRHLALFSWASAAGFQPPRRLTTAFREAAALALANPAALCPHPEYDGSLCNGFAGLAIVAVAAHEALGDENSIETARVAMLRALKAGSIDASLCCGRAGLALALMRVAAQASEEPWRDLAHLQIESVLSTHPEAWSSEGLVHGRAVIPCLAELLKGCSESPQSSCELPPAVIPNLFIYR